MKDPDSPATDAQKALLERNDVVIPEGMTKKQASDKIQEIIGDPKPRQSTWKPKGGNPEKDKLIIRQCCIKAGAEMFQDVEAVIRAAEEFEKWINR